MERNVQSNIKHKTMTHRCRDCSNRPMFSVKKGTVTEVSNVGLLEMSNRDLPDYDQSERRIEYETASGLENLTEISLAFSSPIEKVF